MTRPATRAKASYSVEAGQADPAGAAMSEEGVAAPKKKSWTSWLPWQRDKQKQAHAASGPLSAESPAPAKPVTVNRPSSPRGRDRHFPPPQPVTDPETVASVKGTLAPGQPVSPKPKKSLLQSLRKPSWLPFTQREENVAEQRPLNDEGQPGASGKRSTKVVEYPDVVPPKYRTGGLGGTRSANREEVSASAKSAPESYAGSVQQPQPVQRQALESDSRQVDPRSNQASLNESLPTATPSLVRSFRRPPPDPVPSLPDEASTAVVANGESETVGAAKPVGAGPLYDIVSSACRSGNPSPDQSEPVMLKSVAPRVAKSDGSLQFVPTDLAGRNHAKGPLDAVAAQQPIDMRTASSAMKPGQTGSLTSNVAAAPPATAWTAKKLATTAGAPASAMSNAATNSATTHVAVAKGAATNGEATNTTTANESTKSASEAATGPSAPGQPAWQVNPFAPPPAARLATWPETGPRRMTSRPATSPEALRPLPPGSAANLAAATAESRVESTAVETPMVEKTPTQVQPLLTTRTSATESVSATRDRAVEPVATEATLETPPQEIVTTADTSDAAEPQAPLEAVSESRSSSDPDGSWVDAYRQLIQRNDQTHRRPTAGSPTRRLSSEEQSAAPIRRR